eukprot:8447816-Alexandrium_andersonii.AAC.1
MRKAVELCMQAHDWPLLLRAPMFGVWCPWVLEQKQRCVCVRAASILHLCQNFRPRHGLATGYGQRS